MTRIAYGSKTPVLTPKGDVAWFSREMFPMHNELVTTIAECLHSNISVNSKVQKVTPLCVFCITFARHFMALCILFWAFEMTLECKCSAISL